MTEALELLAQMLPYSVPPSAYAPRRTVNGTVSDDPFARGECGVRFGYADTFKVRTRVLARVTAHCSRQTCTAVGFAGTQGQC